MTEQEMKGRIKEINMEIEELKEERHEYEDYLYKKKMQKKLDDRKKYIGKCYIDKGGRNIKAFKILNVSGKQGEETLCAYLFIGDRCSSHEEYGLMISTLYLWTNDTPRMMLEEESDLKVIDCYSEITQEEFDELCEEYFSKFKSAIK